MSRLYVLDQRETQIYNSDAFDQFFIAEKADATLIVASKGRGAPSYTLGEYADMPEARDVLGRLYHALRTGEASFDMPLSAALAPERTIYDKRVKRRGGS